MAFDLMSPDWFHFLDHFCVSDIGTFSRFQPRIPSLEALLRRWLHAVDSHIFLLVPDVLKLERLVRYRILR